MFLRNYGWIGAAVVIMARRIMARRGGGGLGRRRRNQAAGASCPRPGWRLRRCSFMPRPTTRAPGAACCTWWRRSSAASALVLAFPVIPDALKIRQLDPARDSADRPALRDQQLLLDVGADQGRPRRARPDRRLQAISVDHRARAARPDAGAGGHACSCSSAICPMPSRSASRTAGPTATPASSPRPRPRLGRARGFAWYSGSSSPWNDTGGFVRLGWLVARQHDQLRLDGSRARAAARAAAASSGGGGGGAAAAAGRLRPVGAGRRKTADRLVLVDRVARDARSRAVLGKLHRRCVLRGDDGGKFGAGRDSLSAQSSAARHASRAMPCAMDVAVEDPAHLRARRSTGSMSRWKSKKPTWPISSAVGLATRPPTSPMPMICQKPADAEHAGATHLRGSSARRRNGA